MSIFDMFAKIGVNLCHVCGFYYCSCSDNRNKVKNSKVIEPEKKTTSIDWLFLMLNNRNQDQEFNNKILQKAKELHKQEIIEAWSNGEDNFMEEQNKMDLADGLEYYEKTFKS